MDIRDTIAELIKDRKVRIVLLTEGQFVGKYVCSNCKSDWTSKVSKNDDDEDMEDASRCGKCGVPSYKYKYPVNAEAKDDEDF